MYGAGAGGPGLRILLGALELEEPRPLEYAVPFVHRFQLLRCRARLRGYLPFVWNVWRSRSLFEQSGFAKQDNPIMDKWLSLITELTLCGGRRHASRAEQQWLSAKVDLSTRKREPDGQKGRG